MAFSLTSEQQAAVDNRGGGLLVSAAAGSGKTRVLVERLLARVEGEGLDIDRFLVITYTKAAAAELRGRIVEELSARLAERPTDAHLRRQATLVYKAQISTVHAFCAQLLRECGHLLELDPDFRLCDEGEAGILMLRALNDVLDRRYEDIAEGSDFARLVDTMSAGRDDSRLMQIVLDIRGRVQAHPNPAAWLDGQERAFALEGVDDPGETPWGRLLLDDAGRQGAYWRDKIARALELCPCDANLDANYAPSLSATLAALDAFVEGTRRGWDAARAALPIPFPAAGRKKIVDCPDAAEQVKAIRSTCKKRMEKLGEWFEDCGADLLEDLRAVHPAVRGLFALVKDFEGAYAAEKARRGMVDFADLEHMAVRLLVGEDGAPTELARQWSARYDEIMVDEYQDTNEVQNAIFTALSREGRNLFLVGDVKQSIYRFRLADPTIFLGKYRAFADYTRAAEGEERRLILSRNFRSRPEVLEGANFVFRSVMSADFGEMDYTADEALYPGAPFPPDGRYAVELDAVDASAEGEEEKTARDLIEARFAAKRIRTLVDGGFPVSDGEGGERPVRPADIVILLRSPNTVLHHYARALGERDIPWEAEGGGDFFAATEVNVALSLLQIVDNPRQDVPLISVLRSPVYGFSADRLAELRAASPDTDFYAALTADGGEDSRAFLTELDELRFGAGELSSHELLWQLYDRTNLLGVFGAMERGEERQSNLLTLAELAPDAACPVEPQVLAGCQSVGQWVLLPALARPDGEVLRRAAGVQVPVPAADFGPAWDIRFVDGAEFQAEPEESAISPSGPPDGEMISAGAGEETAALAARLAWHYPHGAEVELPSKLTATQLKGRALDEEAAEAAVRPPRPIRLGRPRFAAEEFGLTPAQKGTALHLVMQYIDFERTERVEQVRAEIARLVERAFLTPQQGEAVDPAKIAAFFASPLGRELMASTSLRREFKFSILVPAADYYPQAGAEEQVLLQGVVDCCFETLEGITVVDFKTDRVDRRSVAARAEEYRPQLAAYSRALEEITGKPVIRRCLWFFALDQAVDV